MEECWLHDPSARPTIDDVARRLEGHLEGQMQEDTRPAASWAQIALTRPNDRGSFSRALEIIDEMIQHQQLSLFDALPMYYLSRPSSAILPSLNKNFPTMNEKRKEK
ncbi:hypothetical protein C0995_013002, partial [Termitomyces sp. Mi166